MSRSGNRKSGRRWRTIAAQVYSEETHCWLCLGYVDQRLDYTHPMARGADHLRQLSHGGAEHDRANTRLAHQRCNTARSNALRHLPVDRCACSVGMPCAVLVPSRRRGYVALDPSGV